MLKINLRDTPAEERWILHGRLTAPWVRELRASWRKNHRTEQVRPRRVSTTLRQVLMKFSEFFILGLST
jgi:hypothetical protein